MGKKNKKSKSGSSESETGMPRHVRREILEIVNYLLEKCSIPFGSQSTEWNDFLDVYKLVERLRKKQQNYVMHLPSRDENMEAFMKWLTDNGVDVSAVTVEQFDQEGYGLKAARDIQESEMFLSIPRQLMMTTETAHASVLGTLMKEDKILQSMPNVAMALHVLCEMASPNSFWQPYFQILPNSYTVPLYFTPDEIQLLKGSPAISEILNQYRNITRQYSYFFRLFQGHTEGCKLPIKNFCFDDYRWAVSTVMTRQNQILASSNGTDPSNLPPDTALIPLWDMCNHTNGWITTDYNDKKNCSECFAMHHFPCGSQVVIFYGPRSNSELFLHNGFVFDNNQNDRLSVKMGVSKNDPLYAMKAEVLARISLGTNRIFSLYSDPERPVDPDLLAYLRVFSMDQDMLLHYLMGEGCSVRQQQLRNLSWTVSAENETKAWLFLETRAQLLLKSYPTTVEEDMELLSKGGLSSHTSLAVRLRLAEKKILLSAMHYAAQQKTTAHERAQRMETERDAAGDAAAAWEEFHVSDVPSATGEEEFVRVDGVHVYGSDIDRANVREEFRNSILRGEHRTGMGNMSDELQRKSEKGDGEMVKTDENCVADALAHLEVDKSEVDVTVGSGSVGNSSPDSVDGVNNVPVCNGTVGNCSEIDVIVAQ